MAVVSHFTDQWLREEVTDPPLAAAGPCRPCKRLRLGKGEGEKKLESVVDCADFKTESCDDSLLHIRSHHYIYSYFDNRKNINLIDLWNDPSCELFGQSGSNQPQTERVRENTINHLSVYSGSTNFTCDMVYKFEKRGLRWLLNVNEGCAHIVKNSSGGLGHPSLTVYSGVAGFVRPISIPQTSDNTCQVRGRRLLYSYNTNRQVSGPLCGPRPIRSKGRYQVIF
ncbi:hypothetical protein J6590_007838 [Homalodisca vitripennis]|nr:hypothetical protein J6590_095727 [Homalodisca vitripennis]KAG8283829.1 hypothetical protein J6590_007838 [Homalodisca vitripennis]